MSDKGELHKGHRQRMMQKFLENDIKIFAEHEIMEMILFMCLPRVNTNEIAHDLIRRFGNVKNVLNAPPQELTKINGIGPNAAVQLRFIGELSSYINLQKVKGIKFDASTSIIDFCIKHYEDIPYECVSFYLLDEQFHMIYQDDLPNKKLNAGNFDFKEILKQAVKYECTSVILSHNHPNGQAYTSNLDVASTRILANLLKTIDVKLIDHIIVHDDHGYSMRSSGMASDIWN